MKILTITGTRPELIRLSVILRKLDTVCEHVHAYTNQNSQPELSTIFFEDLKIRKPDYTFYADIEDRKNMYTALHTFIGWATIKLGNILTQEKPDKVLVLGDTNSGLISIIASKMGFPVYHMEAGNRCYDETVPEELNRKIIDICSYMNLPYTGNSKQNLLKEGFHKNRVFKIGNPINEVLKYYRVEIVSSDILERLNIQKRNGQPHKKFALLSLHRSENVDTPSVVKSIMSAMTTIGADMNVIFPIHPRTKDQFKKQGVKISDRVVCIDPIGFFDFVRLEQEAEVIFTDSGTVPEEACLFSTPCVVLRNTTERQELMESGSLILAGTKKQDILTAYYNILKLKQQWIIPDEYSKDNVSDTVLRILLGQNVSIKRKKDD